MVATFLNEFKPKMSVVIRWGYINMIEARYKTISLDIIRRYNNEQASLDEIVHTLKKEFSTYKIIKTLTGGRVSNVYKINHYGKEKVVKFSKGIYRVNELKREAEVLKYINNIGSNNIVPKIESFIMLDNIAYIVEDYFDGKTIREKFRAVKSVQERLKIWEEAGKVLSNIHMLCQDEDKKSEWLMGQFEMARVNMENGLLDQ